MLQKLQRDERLSKYAHNNLKWKLEELSQRTVFVLLNFCAKTYIFSSFRRMRSCAILHVGRAFSKRLLNEIGISHLLSTHNTIFHCHSSRLVFCRARNVHLDAQSV